MKARLAWVDNGDLGPEEGSGRQFYDIFKDWG